MLSLMPSPSILLVNSIEGLGSIEGLWFTSSIEGLGIRLCRAIYVRCRLPAIHTHSSLSIIPV